jgi:uncharacterized coiled-coil protein SlyX
MRERSGWDRPRTDSRLDVKRVAGLYRWLSRPIATSRFWALVAVAAVVLLAIEHAGPFTVSPRPSSDLLTRLFGDPLVVGAIHLAVFAAALYLVASIVGLIHEGRWINEIGRGGAKVDTAKEEGSEALTELEARLADAEAQADQYRTLAEQAAQLAERAVVAGEHMRSQLDRLQNRRGGKSGSPTAQSDPPAPPPPGP